MNKLDRAQGRTDAGPYHWAMPLQTLRKARTASAMLILALAASSCAGITAESARYRHAFRQGRQSGKGMMIYAVNAEEFPQGSSFEAIRDANPSGEGAQLFRDQVLTDVTIGKTEKELGLPGAIGFASSSVGQVQRFAMFYKAPARSLVLRRSSMDVQWLSLTQLYKSHIAADLPTVPRSIQRLFFNEGPLAPPWPVTIPPELHGTFVIPQLPAAPSTMLDAHDYAAVANDLTARL